MNNKIQLRCYGANDNFCNFISPDTTGIGHTCDGCGGCNPDNEYFEICDCGDFFSVSYTYKVKDIVIGRFSERIDKSTLKQC